MIKLAALIKKHYLQLFFALVVLLLIVLLVATLAKHQATKQELSLQLKKQAQTANKLEAVSSELKVLKNEDQYVINQDLGKQVETIEGSFSLVVDNYEQLLELEEKVDDDAEMKELFADSLFHLSQFNYASASASLDELAAEIKQTKNSLIKPSPSASFRSAPQSSTPPENGYSRQKVSTKAGSFLVSIIAADISSTKVIIATAADSDCSNDCPVKSLSQYVAESGAYAGINGTYFCPASYPSCSDKKNSFDLLVMNQDKTYFNSNNNVYSNNPAVIFGNGFVRFVSSASQWGRDTSVDGVISNYPLLVFAGEVKFSGDGDPKKGSKGNRSFVAAKGNKVYIGVVHSATVAESALVMKALGMDNAMNLDNGGSTALWSSGYKVGPGRNLPNALLFLRK